jgi:hypothetical protein
VAAGGQVEHHPGHRTDDQAGGDQLHRSAGDRRAVNQPVIDRRLVEFVGHPQHHVGDGVGEVPDVHEPRQYTISTTRQPR